MSKLIKCCALTFFPKFHGVHVKCWIPDTWKKTVLDLEVQRQEVAYLITSRLTACQPSGHIIWTLLPERNHTQQSRGENIGLGGQLACLTDLSSCCEVPCWWYVLMKFILCWQTCWDWQLTIFEKCNCTCQLITLNWPGSLASQCMHKGYIPWIPNCLCEAWTSQKHEHMLSGAIIWGHHFT